MTDLLGHGSAPYLYCVIFVVVLGEAIVLVGAFIPTFSTLLAAGALASHGSLDLVGVIAVAATAVVIGDRLGHLAGRVGKQQVPSAIQRHPRWAEGLTRTQQLMSRHGSRAIFIGRFVPVVRTVTPYLTGRAQIRYRTLLPYSVGAALLWAGAEAGLGYVAVSGATWLPLHLS